MRKDKSLELDVTLTNRSITLWRFHPTKKVFEVVVWGIPETRSSITDVRNLMIQAPNGTYLRLSEVADVKVTPHPVMIKREGVARYTDVEIDVFGRSLTMVANEVSQRLAGHSLPSEYHAEVLGKFAKRDSMKRRIFTFIMRPNVAMVVSIDEPP